MVYGVSMSSFHFLIYVWAHGGRLIVTFLPSTKALHCGWDFVENIGGRVGQWL